MVLNYARFCDPGSPLFSPEAADLNRAAAELIAKVRAVDALTVEITLTQPSPEFLRYMTQEDAPGAQSLVSPLALKRFGPDGCADRAPGTGAFRFHRRFDTPHGSGVELVRNDDYWGGLPPLKQIRFVEVPEVASRINGLLSGEYQFACDIPPDLIGEVEKNAGFEVQGGTVANHRLTVFDKNHAQLADPRVRRAMTHSIDRQAIVDSLWAGRTTIPAGLQWPFYDKMFIEGWTVPEFNPELATSLLKEAGYKGDPIPYRLLNNYYTNQNATAQVLVEMWKAVGLNVQIESKENWAQIMEAGPTRAVRDWSNSAPFNDPVSSIVAQHGPNGQQQQIGEWTNAEMNQLCEVLETSVDHDKRKKAFARMLEICEREDPAYTVLHQNAAFTAKPTSIKWKAVPAFALDFGPGNFAL